MELAYKEDLFFSLSVGMEKEEAKRETERIVNNFKKLYSPKKSKLEPIIGNDTYRYYIDHLPEGFYTEYESRIDKYVDGKWKLFMKFDIWGTSKCRELIKRLELGGNTLIEF